MQRMKRKNSKTDRRFFRAIESGLVLAAIVGLSTSTAWAGACDFDVCDFDFNNDGAVNDIDEEMLRAAFGSGSGEPDYNDDFDADGDGVIGGADWAAFVGALGGQ